MSLYEIKLKKTNLYQHKTLLLCNITHSPKLITKNYKPLTNKFGNKK